MGTHLCSTIVTTDPLDQATWLVGGAAGDIDIDNDGVMNDRCIFDLSHEMSRMLGRQMSQTAIYRINYIRIELQNVDDLIDNWGGAAFGGVYQCWTPSKHRIKAIKLARAAERAAETMSYDADSYLISTHPTYKGLRFNWDDDGQVLFPTLSQFGIAGNAEWSLNDIFNAYAQATPGGTNLKTNPLWGQRIGTPESGGFSVFYRNQTMDDDAVDTTEVYDPESGPSEVYFDKPLECLGGLLHVFFTHSSTDSPQGIDDDYKVRLTVGVESWEEF